MAKNGTDGPVTVTAEAKDSPAMITNETKNSPTSITETLENRAPASAPATTTTKATLS